MTVDASALKKEAILLGGLLLAAGETAAQQLPSGTGKTSLSAALPVILAAVLRQLHTSGVLKTTTKGGQDMADLSKLTAAIGELVAAAQAVEQALVAASSADQPAIDQATSQVQSVTQGLQGAVAPPAAG